MKGWYSIQAKAGGTASISIYDEIGMLGITARRFSEELSALGRVSHIDLHIHSPGGDVFEGMAIYNLLKTHPAHITVTIDGIACSMASVIAMVGDKVRIPENGMMMIHRPQGIKGGDSTKMRRHADLLDKIEEALIPAYAAKTGKSNKELAAMLEVETWMNGKECVEQGFADELLEPVQVMARFESKRIEDMTMSDAIKNLMTAERQTPAKDDYRAQEKQRVTAIKAMFEALHCTAEDTGVLVECLADVDCTIDKAREVMLEAKGRKIVPVDTTSSNANRYSAWANSANYAAGGSHIHAGNGNITGNAIQQGLNARLGYETAERGNPYAMMSLFDMAKASLTDRGIGISGFGNRSQIVNLALSHSTSDFAYILAAGAEKSILMGWQNSDETFHQWTKKGSLTNFHEAKRVGLNGFSSLGKVPEGAEYKYITTEDRGTPIALATYGNLFSITRQAIINDDLSQLSTIPQAMGRAAARTVGNLVYLELTANHKFTDGKTLFHDNHRNLIASDMSMEGLAAARKAMRLQQDGNGDPINVTPAFIIVPAELEAAANRAVLSSSSPFQLAAGNAGNQPVFNQNPGIINTVKDMGQIVVEPRLDKFNNKEWYVAAAQGMDTIEVAYLDGMDTPYLEQQEGFETDGVCYKVRIDAGVAALDYRGLVKSRGK